MQDLMKSDSETFRRSRDLQFMTPLSGSLEHADEGQTVDSAQMAAHCWCKRYEGEGLNLGE